MAGAAAASVIVVPRRMSPQTVYRIALEIEHFRALLTIEEKWLQAQPQTESRAEGFRRIDFYRGLLTEATTRLGEQ
jgi:hypothetical protein